MRRKKLAKKISLVCVCVLSLACTLLLVACGYGDLGGSRQNPVSTETEPQDGQGSAETQEGQTRFSVLDGTNKTGMRVKTMVIVDGETGVQYLWLYRGAGYGAGAGVTVLLDSNGKPLLAPDDGREGEGAR